MSQCQRSQKSQLSLQQLTMILLLFSMTKFSLSKKQGEYGCLEPNLRQEQFWQLRNIRISLSYTQPFSPLKRRMNRVSCLKLSKMMVQPHLLTLSLPAMTRLRYSKVVSKRKQTKLYSSLATISKFSTTNLIVYLNFTSEIFMIRSGGLV